MHSDGELLAGVLQIPGFLEGVLQKDDVSDWTLAKRFGEFLVRIDSDSEIMGHALQARASRHLGEIDQAKKELKICQTCIKDRGLKPWEIALLQPLLEAEEKIFSD
jgi:hypothetical protein